MAPRTYFRVAPFRSRPLVVRHTIAGVTRSKWQHVGDCSHEHDERIRIVTRIRRRNVELKISCRALERGWCNEKSEAATTNFVSSSTRGEFQSILRACGELAAEP